jgi:type IV pilus assembly protein PilA
MTPEPNAGPGLVKLPTPGLARAALILACIPCACIWVIGLVMGIVAHGQIKARPYELGGLGVAKAAIIVGSIWGVVSTIGILAAIAIPNFIKFQARSKQSECKAYLKSAYTAEKSYFGEKQTYDTHPKTIGFAPEKGNRYLYVFSNEGVEGADQLVAPDSVRFPGLSSSELWAGIPYATQQEIGVSGTCPNCNITIACSGNIDNDPGLDVWTVSTEDRPGAPAGVPTNVQNDVDF